jgi:hypothetical protein
MRKNVKKDNFCYKYEKNSSKFKSSLYTWIWISIQQLKLMRIRTLRFFNHKTMIRVIDGQRVSAALNCTLGPRRYYIFPCI